MAKKDSVKTAYLGTFVWSKSLDELEILHDGAVLVDANGTIVAIEKGVTETSAKELFGDSTAIRICRGQQFFFPGFIGMIGSYLAFKLPC